MTDLRSVLLTLLLLSACGRDPQPNGPPSAGALRIDVEAHVEVGPNLVLEFRNEDSSEVCFSSSDLTPGNGRTFVRDSRGQTLNSDGNPALELLRGINVAEPVVVLRAGQRHSQGLDLTGFRELDRELLVRVEVLLFRCSDLFDPGTSEVRTLTFTRTYRIAGRDAREVAPGP